VHACLDFTYASSGINEYLMFTKILLLLGGFMHPTKLITKFDLADPYNLAPCIICIVPSCCTLVGNEQAYDR